MRHSAVAQTAHNYIAKDDHELVIFLSPPSEHWDYSYIPPCLIAGAKILNSARTEARFSLAVYCLIFS